MANKINGVNPWIIDTGGGAPTVSLNTKLSIAGVKVVPSGASWSVILKDSNGNIVYQDNQYAGGAWLSSPFNTTGLVIDTLTSITTLLIYLSPSA